ncbi:MAG TPA: hypothetical protein VHB79_08865 [Polyangiaceae bacterium]|nr:hypothetical protein [Polyangiaceae bacterium]
MLGYRCARPWATLLSLSLSLHAGIAAAEPDAATRAAARQLAEDGVMALQNGDATTAAQKLEKAHQALQVPSVALWSARALVKLGALVEARERYIEATRLPVSGDKAVQEQAKVDAAAEREQLTARIPSLLIRVAPASSERLEVTLDGKALPAMLLGEERPTNPGPHRIVAKQGTQEANASITLAEGEHQRVELKLGAAAQSGATPSDSGAPSRTSPTGSTRTTLGWAALIAGGAGLVTGGVTGILALKKKSTLDDDPRCQNGQCLDTAADDVHALRTWRTVSTVGFVAGGVLCAAGVTLLLTAKSPQSPEAQARWSITVGPAHLSVRSSF